jgi:hypothetical protein
LRALKACEAISSLSVKITCRHLKGRQIFSQGAAHLRLYVLSDGLAVPHDDCVEEEGENNHRILTHLVVIVDKAPIEGIVLKNLE